MGDRTGYATHGDYVFGWKDDSLQRAMDSSCMFQACGNGKPLLSQTAAKIYSCKVQNTVKEDTDGCKLNHSICYIEMKANQVRNRAYVST